MTRSSFGAKSFFSLGWWGIGAVPLAAFIAFKRSNNWKPIFRALMWASSTLLVWDVGMFIPGSTVNHQGTYICQLVLLLVLGASFWRVWRVGFWLIASLQVIDFIRIWLPLPPNAPPGILLEAPAIVIVLALAFLAVLFAFVPP